MVITPIRGLIALFMTTHERVSDQGFVLRLKAQKL